MRLVVLTPVRSSGSCSGSGGRSCSPHLDLYVPARMWNEARHEVSRRLGIRVRKGLPQEIADRFWHAAVRFKDESVSEVPEEL